MSGWEEVSRTLADARARQEEEMAWGVPAGSALPFRFRWEHVCEVVKGACFLAVELDADVDIAIASAWLHDICKTEPMHGQRGAEEAGKVLTGTDFPQAKIPAVSHALRHHVGLFRSNPAMPLAPVETAILWDADKLSKLGVPQIAALLSGPRAQGQTLSARQDQIRDYVYSWIDRTAESMNTAPARALARVRYQEMCTFLQTWQNQATALCTCPAGGRLQDMKQDSTS